MGCLQFVFVLKSFALRKSGKEEWNVKSVELSAHKYIGCLKTSKFSHFVVRDKVGKKGLD